jgi:hypothetical protein
LKIGKIEGLRRLEDLFEKLEDRRLTYYKIMFYDKFLTLWQRLKDLRTWRSGRRL